MSSQHELAPTNREVPRLRVLIVESRPGLRSFAIDALQAGGYQVEATDTAMAGLDLLGKLDRRFSAVVVDDAVADIPCTELVRRVVALHPTIAVIATCDSAEVRVEGTDLCLPRPYRMTQIIEAVADAIAERASDRARQDPDGRITAG